VGLVLTLMGLASCAWGLGNDLKSLETLNKRYAGRESYIERLNDLQGRVYELGVPRRLGEVNIGDNLRAYARGIERFPPVYSERIGKYNDLIMERGKLEEEHPRMKLTIQQLDEEHGGFRSKVMLSLLTGGTLLAAGILSFCPWDGMSGGVADR